MRAFTTIVALFAAGAFAVDGDAVENVKISSFTINRKGSDFTNASFKLNGSDANDLACDTTPSIQSDPKIRDCGSSKYRFALNEVEGGALKITLYHQTGAVSGLWGEKTIPLACVDGTGADACSSPSDIDFKLSPGGDQ